MSDMQSFKDRSFSTENDEVEGYQQLSRLAIWSIPLGLLSALSMISPLLWFIPVVCVAFAGGALWQIARSNDITGRRLAIVGLVLGLFFGSWGISWTLSRQLVITRQARMHANEWLSLMQDGKYMEAHQLTINFHERLPPGSPLRDQYNKAATPSVETGPDGTSMMMPLMSLQANLKDFKESGIPKMMVEVEGDFKFEFIGTGKFERDDQFSTKVDQLFRLTFPDGHVPREMDVRIEMSRTLDLGTAYWQVEATRDMNAPST